LAFKLRFRQKGDWQCHDIVESASRPTFMQSRTKTATASFAPIISSRAKSRRTWFRLTQTRKPPSVPPVGESMGWRSLKMTDEEYGKLLVHTLDLPMVDGKVRTSRGMKTYAGLANMVKDMRNGKRDKIGKMICEDCGETFEENEGRPNKYDPNEWLCDGCHDSMMEE